MGIINFKYTIIDIKLIVHSHELITKQILYNNNNQFPL